MIRILVIVLLLGLAGCDQTTPQTSSPPAATAAQASPWDAFEPLPAALQEAVTFRDEAALQLAVDPSAPAKVTAAELARLLKEHHTRVILAMRASRQLTGPVPASQEYTEAQVRASEHLLGIHARVLNVSRLLRADATRCWQEGDADGCAARLAACVRIAAVLLADQDASIKIRSTIVLASASFELAKFTDAGLANRMGDPAKTELADTLASPELGRALAGTPVAEAFYRARNAITGTR